MEIEITEALRRVKGLKEYYDAYSAAFDIVVQQLEGTMTTHLDELETVKKERDSLLVENEALKAQPVTESDENTG